MSSIASNRTARRKAAQSPIGKLKAKLAQAERQAGEARMAVLNMRQMYRQTEQEILVLRGRLQKAETLAAAVMIASDNLSVVVTQDHMDELAEGYSRIHTEAAEDGMLVVLIPAEDVEEDDEEGVDEAVGDEETE